jgi:hypothetical protein
LGGDPCTNFRPLRSTIAMQSGDRAVEDSLDSIGGLQRRVSWNRESNTQAEGLERALHHDRGASRRVFERIPDPIALSQCLPGAGDWRPAEDDGTWGHVLKRRGDRRKCVAIVVPNRPSKGNGTR